MRAGGQALSEVVIHSPIALDPSPITLAAAAALVFVVVVACIIIRRRRDPVGRALAAHTVALSALRDSALRATSTPAATTPGQPSPPGVVIVTSTPSEGDRVVS
jgi:hypothetical protein